MSAPEAVTAPSASDNLTTQEKLLFAQAVYKVGAAAWDIISNLLTSHPLSEMNGKVFSPEQCETIYVGLMTSIGQNVPAPDAMKPRNKTHLHLAQTFYFARLKELKSEVESYENRFTVLMGEINAVKSGTMDDAIKEEVKAGLVRKYGKKLLDWLPEDEALKMAVEAGPVKDGETDPAQEKAEVKQAAVEPDVAMAEPQTTELAADEAAAAATVTEETVEEMQPVEETKTKTKGKKDVKAKEVKDTSRAKDKEDTNAVSTEQDAQLDMETSSPTAAKHVDEPTATLAARRPSSDKPPRSNRRKGSEPAAVMPKTPVAPSPASDLSPPPSAQPESKQEPTTPVAGPSSPTPAETTRTSKRKASTQPRGAPVSKRSGKGRRATSPTQTHSEAATDHEGDDGAHMADADADAEPEALTEEGGRGRRSSKRHVKAHDTPPPSSRHKESSPAVSRRAQSVSSSASTPQAVEEKRPRRGKNRGMRDEVVSKSVREQSAAVESVKEEDDEAESPKSPAEESRPSRTSARRGKKEATPEDKNQSATPATVRKTRSARTPTQHELAGDEEEGESTPLPGGSAVETKVEKTDRGSEKPEKRGGRKSEPKDGRAAQKLLYSLLDTIQSHQHGAVFQNPVKKSDAPAYYDIIKKPMDTKKIRQRIRDGKITNIDQFERDILLVFANATMYNEEGSQVYLMAKEMLGETGNHIAHFRTMQDDLAR